MVLEIKSPILGFEKLQSVVVKPVDEIFFTLHETNDSDSLFTVANPYKLMEEYDFEVPDSVKLLLDLNEDSPIQVYCMVVHHDPKEESTINLQAPLIVNSDKKIMAQVALNPVSYPDYGLQEPIRKFMN